MFGVLRRPLEDQVLEQMRHPGLAVVLVARADPIGHVHGDGLLGGVREQQHGEPVREPVLGNSFDGRHELDAAGNRGLCSSGRLRHQRLRGVRG